MEIFFLSFAKVFEAFVFHRRECRCCEFDKSLILREIKDETFFSVLMFLLHRRRALQRPKDRESEKPNASGK